MENKIWQSIPVPSPVHSWDTDENGRVTVHMVHRGFYAFLAQKLAHTPKVSHLELDEYGSFLWQRMDGKRTVGELAELLHQQYGDAAEPLGSRLTAYLRILRNNRLIEYRKD